MTQPNDTPRSVVSTLRILRRLMGYYRPYSRFLTVIIVFFVAATACELARPKLLGMVVDRLTEASNAARPLLRPALEGAALYMAVALGLVVAGFVYSVLRTRLQQSILSDLRRGIFEKTQRLSFAYHDGHHSGGLITKATRDVDHMRMFFGHIVFEIAQLTVIVLGAVAMTTWIEWRLALVCLVFLPVTAYLIARVSGRLRRLFKDADDEYDNVTSALQENIGGIRVVKAFGQERNEIDKFEGRVGGFFTKLIRSVDYFALYIPFCNSLFALSIPTVLGYGGYLVIEGSMGIGALTAVVFYLNQISTRMRMLGRLVDRTQNAVASAERIYQILDAPETISSDGGQPLPPRRGAVRLDNVSFAYRSGHPVLHDISLDIAPGETVALVGPTGSGKSTAALLLPRFYDVQTGTVSIDGLDVREADLNELRRQVVMVFQEPFLFSATIAENIAYGVPDAPMERVRQAARVAQLDRFIEGLEKGYDTIVGERGINLSGGQKQRLTIARAVLTDPRVLILDDCTSSLDAVTEKELRSTIENVAAQRTTFVISQRVSTIRSADRIVVFREGNVVQQGTHDELIGVEGTYRELFHSQTFEVRGTRPGRSAPALIGGRK